MPGYRLTATIAVYVEPIENETADEHMKRLDIEATRLASVVCPRGYDFLTRRLFDLIEIGGKHARLYEIYVEVYP